jgi:hypothetical protein
MHLAIVNHLQLRSIPELEITPHKDCQNSDSRKHQIDINETKTLEAFVKPKFTTSAI